MENLLSLWQSTGLYNFTSGQVFMMLVGFLLLFLAIKKGFEPLLLLPIGFGAILSNIPVADTVPSMAFSIGTTALSSSPWATASSTS